MPSALRASCQRERRLGRAARSDRRCGGLDKRSARTMRSTDQARLGRCDDGDGGSDRNFTCMADRDGVTRHSQGSRGSNLLWGRRAVRVRTKNHTQKHKQPKALKQNGTAKVRVQRDYCHEHAAAPKPPLPELLPARAPKETRETSGTVRQTLF